MLVDNQRMTTPEPIGDGRKDVKDWQSRKGRSNAAIMLIAALALFLTNLLLVWVTGRYFVIVVLLIPSLTLVGIAGLIEPKIALAISPNAGELGLPLWTRIVGIALMVGGMAVGGWLLYLR